MPNHNEITLLKRFEPIIHFTKGELFYPMDVDPYVQECSLWVQKGHQTPHCLVKDNQLTIDRLAQVWPTDPDTVYFLRFIEDHDLEQLGVKAFDGHATRQKGFRPGRGRLARVGYSSRLIDMLFAITLLARGRVPGDTAIGAYLAYERMMSQREHYSYYARVIYQDDWIVLQYWFFYAFNNWRSGFKGVNDHESDWEMICIYLYETSAGEVQPEWVAYASHDFQGDDLRRRWDDPELEKVGEHPVVYAGAGSHASYFQQGEYMSEFVLPFLTPLVRLVDQQQRFWRRLLKQYQPDFVDDDDRKRFNLFRIPFIDYARGDGLSVGPGQIKSWAEPRLLDPIPEWVLHYRGLWGLYARDPVSGEDAPAGPMYNRDGSVRTAWYDPVSWAGLSKVPPPSQILPRTLARRDEIIAEQTILMTQIVEKRAELTGLTVEAMTTARQPHLKKLHQSHEKMIDALSQTLVELRGQIATNEVLLETVNNHIAYIKTGGKGPRRAHIRHAHSPFSEDELHYGRLAEVWAAVSLGLIMLVFVGLIFLAPQYIWWGMLLAVGLIIAIEATFRKQLQRLVTLITNFLAIIATFVLISHFALQLTAIVILIVGAYIMWQNLREFWY